MNEFSVHHDVGALLKLLCVSETQNECLSKFAIVEIFEKSRNETRNSTANVKFVDRTLKRNHSSFRDKYLDLKSTNAVEADNLINLIARIEDNNEVFNFLRFHKLYANKSKMKRSDVQKVVENLKSVENGMPTSSQLSLPSLKLPVSLSEPLVLVTESTGLNQHSAQELKCDDICSTITYDFVEDKLNEETFPSFAGLPKEERENAIINDLFFVLIGINGDYIKVKSIAGRRKITFSEDFDVIERGMCKRITKICPLYSQLITFMEHHESEGFANGRVNQALVSCIRLAINDYFRHLTEVEVVHKRGKLTLQKLWYFVENNVSNLGILCDICDKVKRGQCVGGAVISILHEKIMSLKGNANACDFLIKIATITCEPYFNMLERWLVEGAVHDLCKEFCIEDKLSEEEEMNSDSWKERFTLVSSRLPTFLTRYSEKILLSGKYLSIIKQFGQTLEEPISESFKYTIDERIYGFKINTAYISSSRQLFNLLVNDFKLIQHFKAIKSCFFMDKGDFIVHFIEMTDQELNKRVDDINLMCVQSLLELSVQTSTLASNPFTDNVGINFADESLTSQVSNLLNQGCNSMLGDENVFTDTRDLYGFESLILTYNVELPLSLLLNKAAIGFYQMLFRLLFICKYVERSLGDLWKFNKGYKSSSLRSLRNRSEVFGLQQNMLYFVQNIEYYFMFEVIEPKFMKFISTVETKIDNFEELLKLHESFCEELSKDCMLSNIKALNLISAILEYCIEFTGLMHAGDQYINGECFTKLHADFNKNLKNLLRVISDTKDMFTTNLVDILCKLDFNEFYAKVINGF